MTKDSRFQFETSRSIAVGIIMFIVLAASTGAAMLLVNARSDGTEDATIPDMVVSMLESFEFQRPRSWTQLEQDLPTTLLSMSIEYAESPTSPRGRFLEYRQIIFHESTTPHTALRTALRFRFRGQFDSAQVESRPITFDADDPREGLMFTELATGNDASLRSVNIAVVTVNRMQYLAVFLDSFNLSETRFRRQRRTDMELLQTIAQSVDQSENQLLSD